MIEPSVGSDIKAASTTRRTCVRFGCFAETTSTCGTSTLTAMANVTTPPSPEFPTNRQERSEPLKASSIPSLQALPGSTSPPRDRTAEQLTAIHQKNGSSPGGHSGDSGFSESRTSSPELDEYLDDEDYVSRGGLEMPRSVADVADNATKPHLHVVCEPTPELLRDDLDEETFVAKYSIPESVQTRKTPSKKYLSIIAEVKSNVGKFIQKGDKAPIVQLAFSHPTFKSQEQVRQDLMRSLPKPVQGTDPQHILAHLKKKMLGMTS